MGRKEGRQHILLLKFYFCGSFQDVSILLLPDLELPCQLMVTLHSIDKGVCYITHQVMPLRLTAMLLIVRTHDIPYTQNEDTTQGT